MFASSESVSPVVEEHGDHDAADVGVQHLVPGHPDQAQVELGRPPAVWS
jgi:hypothetical protein